MSNPSAPDQDATPEPGAEEAQQPTEEETLESSPEPEEPAPEETAPEESAPEEPDPEEPDPAAPTEVIEPEPEPRFESAEPTVVLDGAGDNAADLRYSAPSGFDVKPTEVMESPPEPATDVMSVTGQPRPVAPQAIPPRRTRGRHRSWGLVLALILVIAALAAVAVFGTVWLTHTSSPKVSQEDQVRQTIHDFDNAIQKGDLAQLRGITCGTTRDSYVNYDDQQWAATHDKVIAAKRYPMVASIDEVAVNGQHAEANVTTFIAYEPQVRSTRSFDLQFLDGRWKICQGPIS
jgi:hypothetical protein